MAAKKTCGDVTRTIHRENIGDAVTETSSKKYKGFFQYIVSPEVNEKLRTL